MVSDSAIVRSIPIQSNQSPKSYTKDLTRIVRPMPRDLSRQYL